jgi:ubiquinone/menaquinone biosynthesis C-methylase UbiE
LRSPESYLHDVLLGDEKSVLDVGVGHSGVFDFWFWESRNLQLKACVDIYYFRSDIPNSWLKVKADGCALPFRDNSFDVVMSTETLEHVPPERQEQFLDELYRVSSRLVFVTTTDITAHLGIEQERIERLNPFQKFQAFPTPDLFSRKGFHTLFVSQHHIIAFKRKHPLWDSTFKDMEDYVIEQTGNIDVESVIDVGTGLKGVVARRYYDEVKHVKRGYAVDVWKIKQLPEKWTPLNIDALKLLDHFQPKSVDVVQAFGFLEHLKKDDGYKFLSIAEQLAKKLVIVSAATFVHGPTPDYKVRIDGNPYHYYHSTWHWKDFEALGYETNFNDMKVGITFSDEAIAWKKL